MRESETRRVSAEPGEARQSREPIEAVKTVEAVEVIEEFEVIEAIEPCGASEGRAMEEKRETDEMNQIGGDEVEVAAEPDEGEAQRRRIATLRQKAEELSGGHFTNEGIEQLPPEMEEAFWRQIIAYETAEPTDLFRLLVEGGVSLPAPVLVSEEHLADRLWETIYFLATHGCYLENTDHLSDRELYNLLWERLLREPAILFPDDPNYAYHIDTIGSGSEADQQIYLTYYATEEDRLHWTHNWPEDLLPSRIARPYDRDRLLPRPYLPRLEPLM